MKMKEAVEIAVKTTLSTTPIGGFCVSLWENVRENQIERRQEKWKYEIEKKISQLEVTIDEIKMNENFATCLLRTTELAIKTESDIKREKLANILKNSIIIDVKESKLLTFLSFLERYSDIHINILIFLSRPEKYVQNIKKKYMKRALLSMLLETFPELSDERELVEVIVKTLYNDGLISLEKLLVNIPREEMERKRTTKLGDEFLNYIS